jgi:hypothetical protein
MQLKIIKCISPVADPYPPTFLNCPPDFQEPNPGPVSWSEPIARDNVGLAIQATSRSKPGDTFPDGQFLVEYWAEDYQGNIGRCSFVITVGKGLHSLSSLCAEDYPGNIGWLLIHHYRG